MVDEGEPRLRSDKITKLDEKIIMGLEFSLEFGYDLDKIVTPHILKNMTRIVGTIAKL